MQNLPFLVAQNAATQKTGTATKTQKAADASISFKQVLSKQVEQESPKESLAKSPIIKSAKSQKVDGAVVQASSGQKQVKAKNDLVAEVEFNDAGVALAELANADSVVLPAQNLAKDSTEQGLPIAVNDEEVIQATPGEVNAALVASLQLPLLNSQLPKNTAPDSTVQAQAGLLETTNLSPALRLVQKTTPSTEKQMDGFSDDKSTINNKQTEIGANNRSLLETQPKDNQPSEIAEKFNSTFTAKLSTEPPIKAIQESLAKLPQDATALPQAAAISVVASSAITKVATAQAQAGSINSIAVYPGKAGWDQAISQKVVWMVGAAEQTATLTLNPPDLGPLQVVVSVNNDKADTTFISENPEVRKLLENGIPTLRNLMGQAGIELGQANVGTGKQQQEFQQAARERLASQMSTNTASQSAEKQTITSTASRMNNGLVDTFA